MRMLHQNSSTKLIELAHQPEEQRIRLSDGGVEKVLIDWVQTKSMGKGQVAQCYSVSVCLLIQLKEGSSK